MENCTNKGTELIKKAVKDLGIDDTSETEKFIKVCEFLIENEDFLSWRGKDKPDPKTIEGIQALAKRFFGSRSKKDWPSEPSTIPDEMVSIVMQEVYGYTQEQTEQIKVEHQHSMSAENIVGTLLERYIASVLESHGWVWCAGDFVKAVDFIKYTEGEDEPWTAVQVKNRDNTENSSSSAIRNGKPIEKWFRTFAKTGKDNWKNFPEEEFRSELSEQGFRLFVKKYLRENKSSHTGEN